MLKNFKGLEKLHFINTSIELSDGMFSDLNKLSDVANENHSSKIPSKLLDKTGAIERISLRHNNITEVKMLDSNCFGTQSQVKELDLSFNEISFFDKLPPFMNLLSTLNLSHNYLVSHEFLSAEGERKPKVDCQGHALTVDISHNKLTAFNVKHITRFETMIIIANDNYIANIRMDMPKDLENTAITATLGKNPINCDCENFDFLYKIQQWSKSLNYLTNYKRINYISTLIVPENLSLSYRIL
jgi:hypothetical protein